ncbi:MAG: hypothetical protein Q9188_007688 [Gyalolechia gomerana]
MQGYVTRDLLSLMERPDQAVLLGDRLPPADCKARSVNCLSNKGIDQLWSWALKKGNIREVTVVTGGQAPLKAFASYMTAGTAQKDGQGQMNVSKSECPAAYRDMSDLFKSLNPLKAMPQQLKVNIHHLAWRKQHESTDGPDYRKVPINLEISHMAEAYHVVGGMEGRSGGTWLPGNKVELSNCETQECNESRKFCREYGKLIPFSEKDSYRGPTMCPHAAFGMPCYGPYPVGEIGATLITPHRGKRSRTGDGLTHSTLQQPKRNNGEGNLNNFFKSVR